MTVRGLIVNLGLFLHFRQAIGNGSSTTYHLLPAAYSLSPTIIALTLFVFVFTFAIATFKDVPDMEGDRQYNIRTLTLRLGQRTVFNLALGVLTTCYLGMIFAGVSGLPGVNALFLVVTHVIALGLLWFRSLSVDLQDKRSISRFYQFIWKLFFLEYLIFPAACLLGQM